ncbi:MAG: hypothetical protein ACXWID_14965 [Pyrinomonadaceae bacterium]
MIYDPQMTLRAARALLFERSGFGVDGGYEERWIKVKWWRIPIWLPNTQGRRKAARLHDLHHVLTEYPTTWRGEAEISAWEIGAGGLHRYYAGWVLDLMNLAQGLIINPRGTYCAFMRGRQSANLFRTEFSDELLSHSVGEYRRRLRLHAEPGPASWRDRRAFVTWVFAGIGTYFGAVLLSLAPLIILVTAFLMFART